MLVRQVSGYVTNRELARVAPQPKAPRRQWQTLGMPLPAHSIFATATSETIETVREFYSALSGPILVGIEATGSMQWFLELMEELGIECRVGHPAKIRKAETRKQKHDRRDARLLLTLLAENRFPTIWIPSTEQRDLRTLLRHRHQWVRLRSRVQHTLQSMALNHGLRRGRSLWSQVGQDELRALPLAPHASERRKALLTLYPRLQGSIEELDKKSAKRSSSIPRQDDC